MKTGFDSIEIKARVCTDLIMKTTSKVALNGVEIPGVAEWNLEQRVGRNFLRLELWIDLAEVKADIKR